MLVVLPSEIRKRLDQYISMCFRLVIGHGWISPLLSVIDLGVDGGLQGDCAASRTDAELFDARRSVLHHLQFRVLCSVGADVLKLQHPGDSCRQLKCGLTALFFRFNN